MKAHVVGLRTSFALAIVVLSVLSSDANDAKAPERFVITDLVPKPCFENSTKTRVVVTTGKDGKPRSEATWPTHRLEMIFLNVRVTLGKGEDGSPPAAFFSAPPEKLEVAAPSPGFGGGMLSPEWFNGAVHIFLGAVTVNQYTFTGDKKHPLTFKVVKGRGYVHLCGKGSVETNGMAPIQLGDNETIDSWIQLSGSEDLQTREACAQALGYLAQNASDSKQRSAKDTLASLLRDDSLEVRRNAIESLVRLDATTEMASVLKEMAEKDASDWVKACAKWALQERLTD